MKIIIYTSIFPYPLTEGGKTAQYTFIESAVREHEIILVCENNNDCKKNAPGLQAAVPSLIIKRLNLKEKKKDKSFLDTSLAILEKIQWRLKRRLKKSDDKQKQLLSNPYLINPVRPKNPEIIEQLLQVINEEKPDIVQVDFIGNADIIVSLPKNIRSVLILHDLAFSGTAQSAAISGFSNVYSVYLKNYVQTLELGFIKKFASVITFSEDDAYLLKSIDPEINIETIPFAVPDKNIRIIANEINIEKMVFIGPEQHLANYDAIEWYKNEIEQKMWNAHKIKLKVIGKWSEKTINEFSIKDRIEFLGFIDDLEPVLQSSVMIVPLRIGSGIRTKILDAFAYGIPVISTTLGCEGLGVENGKNILIANSPKEFALAVSDLYQDKTLAKRLAYNAQTLVKKNFSQSKVFTQRLQVYNKLINASLLVETVGH